MRSTGVVRTMAGVVAVMMVSLDTGIAQRAVPRTATPGTPAPRARASQAPPGTAARASAVRVRVAGGSDLSAWDGYIAQRLQAGTLRTRRVDVDPTFPDRLVERFQEYHGGVPVWGSEIVRDSARGISSAIFGEISPELAVDPSPRLTMPDAERRFWVLGGSDAVLLQAIELTVLPQPDAARLAYHTVLAAGGGVQRLFIDAHTGAELLRYSEVQSQSAVGSGTSALGQLKKMSVFQQGSQFQADDRLRPPSLRTYDMRGNLSRAKAVVDAGAPFLASDLAADADNVWTDPAVVDGHANVGFVYDFFYFRFGRRGFDDRDRPITVIVNPTTQQGALTLPSADLGKWAANAFWCGSCGPAATGVLVFGNGLPPNFTLGGRFYSYFAGALDIVAHEYAHGVIDSSSRLIYVNESGALNEAFSDVMGISAEFWHHVRAGLRPANYLMGEDTIRGSAGGPNGNRSLENPAAYDQPDHYSRRYLGTADNGGVHINSGIASHAFYLAIEGGRNRTSGIMVQGVGAANRQQIERVFYRAFVYLMPASSTFASARAATIQAARDLHGPGSAVEQSITQAWTAVGVP